MYYSGGRLRHRRIWSVVATHAVRVPAGLSTILRLSDEWLLAAAVAAVAVFVFLFSLQQDYAQNRTGPRLELPTSSFVEEIDVVTLPNHRASILDTLACEIIFQLVKV